MVTGLAERRALVAVSFTAYILLVFIGIARVEVPGLGLGHLLYIPVALLALATGPSWGALAGASSAGIYVLGASLNPNFAPDAQLLSVASLIRFATFTGIGFLIGAAASRNRDLLQRLREHAERDHLTELVNTRGFESELDARLAGGLPFALVLADVDDLKLVNDREGHEAGNDYLRRVAAVLLAETAPTDAVARIGGDEFAVLAEVEQPGAAATMVQRLQAALAAAGLSTSLGYAVYPGDGEDHLALFRTADRRLYDAKVTVVRRLRSVS